MKLSSSELLKKGKRMFIFLSSSEEFTFRACMVPILLGFYTHQQVRFLSCEKKHIKQMALVAK
jgi:hypothetical protein